MDTASPVRPQKSTGLYHHAIALAVTGVAGGIGYLVAQRTDLNLGLFTIPVDSSTIQPFHLFSALMKFALTMYAWLLYYIFVWPLKYFGVLAAIGPVPQEIKTEAKAVLSSISNSRAYQYIDCVASLNTFYQTSLGISRDYEDFQEKKLRKEGGELPAEGETPELQPSQNPVEDQVSYDDRPIIVNVPQVIGSIPEANSEEVLVPVNAPFFFAENADEYIRDHPETWQYEDEYEEEYIDEQDGEYDENYNYEEEDVDFIGFDGLTRTDPIPPPVYSEEVSSEESSLARSLPPSTPPGYGPPPRTAVRPLPMGSISSDETNVGNISETGNRSMSLLEEMVAVSRSSGISHLNSSAENNGACMSCGGTGVRSESSSRRRVRVHRNRQRRRNRAPGEGSDESVLPTP